MTLANAFLPEILLDVHEVARMLKVSAATVRRYTNEGKIRAVKLAPQVIRYHPLDIDAAIFHGTKRMREEVEARAGRRNLAFEPRPDRELVEA
jgi:excisionase family DNA binding protein